MTGILLLAHGSREKKTLDTMEHITNEVRKQLEMDLVDCAYMEFCDMNIEKGLDSLVSKGVDEVIIIPYFLFEGIHIKEDIPNELEEYKKNNPNLKIKFGNTLGTDKRLAMIVADRVREQL